MIRLNFCRAALAAYSLAVVAPAGAAMKVAVVEATAANGTPTYTQDFTDSTTFGGETPKCAIVLGSAATANHSSTANVQATIGFIASAQASIGISDNDATSTNTASYANYSSQAYSLPDFAGNTVGDATGSLIANGARLSWTDQSQGELVKVILIGGDVECAVSSLTSNNGTSAQAVTHGLAAAPQAVIAMSPGQPSGDSTGNARYTLGFWDGSTQSSVGVILNQSGQTTVTSFGRVSTTRILGSKAAAAGFNWDATISNVGSTTFDITLSAATTNLMHFLSLRSTSGTALAVKAGTFGTRTTTGTAADITGMSLAPQLVMYGLSRSIAVDTNYSGADDATVLGIGAAVKNTGTGSTQYATIVNAEADGSATSGTHAYTQASATQALRLLDVNGSDTVQATIDSWDSGGVTHNYSAASTQARRPVFLAIGADAPSTPTLSGVALGTVTSSTIPVLGTSDLAGTAYAARLTDGSSTPTCDAIEAQTATGGVQYASAAASAATQFTATFSSITDGTKTDVVLCVETAGGGDSAVSRIEDAQKLPAVTTGPAVGTVTASTIPITATWDAPGTWYAARLTDGSSTPTCDAIEAQTATGAVQYGSQSVSYNVGATLTFSSITDGTKTDVVSCTENAAGGDSAVSRQEDVLKVPAFSAAPALVSCSTTGCTFSKTLDGAGTVYGVACAYSQTAPTPAEATAETCTGSSAPKASATDDASGNMTVGSALSDPAYSFYFVGKYTGGTEVSALQSITGTCLTAATGKQVINCPTGLTSIDDLSHWAEFNANTDPAVIAGDIPVCDLVTTPGGFPLTFSADGLYEYTGGPAQQRFDCNVWDKSALAMHADTARTWVNNTAPTASTPLITATLDEDEVMDAVVWAGRCNDADGDSLTYSGSDAGEGTGADTRPAGTTNDATSWSGTPTAAGEGSFTETCTDPAGDADTIDVEWAIIAKGIAPDCVGVAQLACVLAIQDQGLAPQASFACSNSVASLTVISQDRTPGQQLTAGSAMAIVVSTGICPRGGIRPSIRLGVGL